MRTLIVLMVIMIALLSAVGHAESPDALKLQADSDVQVAMKLQQQAQDLIRQNATPEKMRVAIDLYLQAGQLFEKSASVYQALGPTYVREDDVKNSYAAMDHCIRMIQEIKKRL